MRTRERYPRLVTLSLLVGRLSLALLRWSGLPELAHPDDARTPTQKLAFALGRCGLRMNEIGFGRKHNVSNLGHPA
jgi:hypothetical protein